MRSCSDRCASLRSTAPYVGAWAGTTDRCASLRSTAPYVGLRSRACWCASLRSTAPYVGAWAGTTDRCASLRSAAPYGAAGGRVRLAALGSILWSFQWVWRHRGGVRLIAEVGHGLVEGVCVVQALELRVVQVVGLGGDACLFAGFGEDELVRP